MKFILLIILLLIVVILWIITSIKFHMLKKETRNTRENDILKEILDASMEKRYMFNMAEEVSYIRDILMDYYFIDYCSIFLKEEHGEFKCISTNIEFKYIISELEEYVFENVDLQTKLAKIKVSNIYLCKERKIKYRYLIPLSTKDGVIGALLIENKKVNDKKDFEIEFFELVVKNISIVLQNLLYQENVTNMAVRDGLTNVWNRNYMNMKIEEKFKEGNNFSIVILDIDDFKKINDTYGHEVGDLVLMEAAKFIEDQLMYNNYIFRYGGEEFVILISDKTAFEVFDYINDIRKDLENYRIMNEKQEIYITASFGIAEYPLDGITIRELVSNSDKALYNSKLNGKNRVTIYTKE